MVVGVLLKRFCFLCVCAEARVTAATLRQPDTVKEMQAQREKEAVRIKETLGLCLGTIVQQTKSKGGQNAAIECLKDRVHVLRIYVTLCTSLLLNS